jgi:glycerate-2-kinase
VLEKYNLHSRTPSTIIEYLKTDDPTRETPKYFSNRIRHFVLQRTADACEAAKKAAEKMELPVYVLTTLLEGESWQAGTFLACVAKEVVLSHRPFTPPCLIIIGGETTTKIDSPSALGGPSQELALGFALEITKWDGLSIAAIDTDGTDGPTDIAGGISDGTSVDRARRKGFDVYEHLKTHNSSRVLKTIGDEIITGNTGTNLCDLNVVYISDKAQRAS